MTARWTDKASPGEATKAGPPPDGSDAIATPDPGIDPYFRWARHTNFRGFARQAGWGTAAALGEKIQIIALAPDLTVLRQVIANSGVFEISEIYKTNIPCAEADGQRLSLHFVATVNKCQSDTLLANVLRLRWKLALPLRDAERVAEGSANGFFGPEGDLMKRRADNLADNEVAAQQDNGKPLTPPRAEKGAIALIDFGCPFLNDVFVEGARTRVIGLWDQGSDIPGKGSPFYRERGWPWQRPAHFTHGREMGPQALNAVLTALKSDRGLEETALYRGIDYLIDYQDPRRRVWFATHGGHLLDVAGGSADPLDKASKDAASKADLLFVQLPALTASDSAGGSLAAHVLDGVRYAMQVVPPESPLVVSISYGNSAGAHDGHSLLESALDELLERRQNNFAIVLAAGNARAAHGHASRLVLAGHSALLRCLLPSGDTTDTFVEVWYPRDAAGIELRVRPPSRSWSAWVSAGREELLLADNPHQEVVALLRHDVMVPNGDRAMALLAVAPTAQPDAVACTLADAGVWEIEVRLGPDAKTGPSGVQIEAWIERDDPPRDSSAGQPRFLDQSPDDERNTMSSLSTGTHTLVASGFNLGTGSIATYASRAGQGGRAPDVLAACEEDELEPTIAAAATRSGEAYRINGTSVAAPVLARRLYNEMVRRGKMSSPTTVARGDWRALLKTLADDDKDPALKPYAEG